MTPTVINSDTSITEVNDIVSYIRLGAGSATDEIKMMKYVVFSRT